MKALPGKTRPRWLVLGGQIAAGAVLISLVVSALPALLFMSLVMALLLIPVLRQLRKEARRAGIDLDAPAREQMIDVTPLHRRIERDFWAFRRRWR
ncbi:hypothetical protein KBY58_08335 [Cyanobium sp. HWJ4-Hawea]|uniref:hypothetical protein n=1 Tax=unclassified Cyanobium TaxID=2627006 RepID=UPI0020CFE11E|nr:MULTISPECIES: hypothetical protein [unclassified Cyanobium]MCP9774844.1 hypothetical protein [Cyanobium sp. WAJ14-Wanaka]MCP9809440.1 hypothetical protein [Cyanobium sp. HWJ4-Hawea]